jgi:hypothetical protein
VATHHDTITWPLSDNVRSGSDINVFQSRASMEYRREEKNCCVPKRGGKTSVEVRGRLGELKYRNIAEGEEQSGRCCVTTVQNRPLAGGCR